MRIPSQTQWIPHRETIKLCADAKFISIFCIVCYPVDLKYEMMV